MITIEELFARWDSGEGKPYKGSLVDRETYAADPTSPSCMCAQGQLLHYVGGRSIEWLMDIHQDEADTEAAKLINCSRAHAVLLRLINDKADGAPSTVLTDPAKVLGDQAHIVLAFWKHLGSISIKHPWNAELYAVRYTEWDDAENVASCAAEIAVGHAAQTAAKVAAEYSAVDAARYVEAGGAAASAATNEIQGAAVMRAKGYAFYFLPLFGFADPEAVINKKGIKS